MIDAVMIDFPVMIKASTGPDHRRVVEIESSVQKVDSEGDLILQSALLNSAESFVKTGHLDLEHLSEVGTRLGIRDPESYIVGRPLKVWDGGETRTFVQGEIMRSADGTHDPVRNRYDALWDTLTADPPVLWRASIYGFPLPGEVEDCTDKVCESGAWRYIVKGIDWRSLAFTRNPMNDHIKSPVRIVTAKAFIDGFAKNGNIAYDSTMPHLGPPPKPYDDSPPALPTIGQSMMLAPRNMHDAIGQHPHILRECAEACGVNTTVGFRKHFETCCGMDGDAANVYAHALMHHLHLERGRK
jgi:hypothetical protein